MSVQHPPLPWTRDELWAAGKLLFDVRVLAGDAGSAEAERLLSVALAVVTDARTGSLVRTS